MMTWMTSMSLFDNAEALALPQLTLVQKESEALFYELVWGEPDEERGPAPAPLKMMWQGYETALAAYSAVAATILVGHGISSGASALNLAGTITTLRNGGDPAPFVLPPWIQDTDVLRSHRSNLMRRWPDSYRWAKIAPDMPYLWPVVDDEGGYELRLSKYDKALLAKGERKLPSKIKERISNV